MLTLSTVSAITPSGYDQVVLKATGPDSFVVERSWDHDMPVPHPFSSGSEVKTYKTLAGAVRRYLATRTWLRERARLNDYSTPVTAGLPLYRPADVKIAAARVARAFTHEADYFAPGTTVPQAAEKLGLRGGQLMEMMIHSPDYHVD